MSDTGAARGRKAVRAWEPVGPVVDSSEAVVVEALRRRSPAVPTSLVHWSSTEEDSGTSTRVVRARVVDCADSREGKHWVVEADAEGLHHLLE